MGKRMNEVAIAVEESTMGKESRRVSSGENKTVPVSDSLVRGPSRGNGKLNHKEPSDEELIVRFVKVQDEEAFSEIVNRHADSIFMLALRITRNRSHAEEVLKEVFHTIEKLDTFRREYEFASWLYRGAVNASYKQLGANKKEYKNRVNLENYTSYNDSGALEGIRLKDWSDIPDEMLLSREGMGIIERAVNELPVGYRLIFLLRDVERLTNSEVAKILEVPLPNVKSSIHRARLFLRDRLSDYFSEVRK